MEKARNQRRTESQHLSCEYRCLLVQALSDQHEAAHGKRRRQYLGVLRAPGMVDRRVAVGRCGSKVATPELEPGAERTARGSLVVDDSRLFLVDHGVEDSGCLVPPTVEHVLVCVGYAQHPPVGS